MPRAKQTTGAKRPKTSQAKLKPAQVIGIKVILLGSKPVIWRRFAVPADITLEGLHDVLQTVMGWTDSHMHQFIDGNENLYGRPDPELDMPVISERETKLCDVVSATGDRFLYEYDFGDGWEHGIEVLAVESAKSGVKYPICLDGARACPPENCGGIYGYVDMLAALGDPDHEDHADLKEWFEGEFDAEAFDLSEVNELLDAR